MTTKQYENKLKLCAYVRYVRIGRASPYASNNEVPFAVPNDLWRIIYDLWAPLARAGIVHCFPLPADHLRLRKVKSRAALAKAEGK